MLKGIKNILFTSNLSSTSQAAFNYATLLATQTNAKIVLLHAIERLPESYEGRLSSLFGEERWEDIVNQNRQDAQSALFGKISSRDMVRTVLSEFCRESGIANDECGFTQYAAMSSDW